MRLTQTARAVLRALACMTLLGTACTVHAQSPEYQQGYRDGYDQGFKQGYDRAMQESRQPPPGAMVAPPPPPPVPKRGIEVLRAWYGESERRSCDATGWAMRRFHHRSSASAEVTNQICGDPAPGQRKDLTVEYRCGPEIKRASAYEFRSLSISCY